MQHNPPVGGNPAHNSQNSGAEQQAGQAAPDKGAAPPGASPAPSQNSGNTPPWGDNKPVVLFTLFRSPNRLAKRFEEKPDGSILAISGTQFASGLFGVCPLPAAGYGAHEILEAFGKFIDNMPSDQAIGLGVPKDPTKLKGDITTKREFKRLNGNTDAITRSLLHFGWPKLGLLLLDGDDIEGLPEILVAIYPAFAKIALLLRPSASASVIDPKTGKRLKAGEHCYPIINDPSKSRDCLLALMRLAWVKGYGRLVLSKRGDVLVRGPIDASVGSPERLSYEGQNEIKGNIQRIARESKVVGGTGMLIAHDLIACADLEAPQAEYEARVEAAKNEPEFCKKRDAARVAYRGEYVAAAVKRGKPRAQVEKEYDTVIAAGKATVGNRTWCPLPEDWVLYYPNGSPFPVSDIKKDPKAFHRLEIADPVEGMDYQTTNCAIIYTDNNRIEIHSRAHGDAFSYCASFDNTDDWSPEDWAEILDRISGRLPFTRGALKVTDFVAFLKVNRFIYKPNGALFRKEGIDGHLDAVVIGTEKVKVKKPKPKKGEAAEPDEYETRDITMPASLWLSRNRPITDTCWAPGHPQLIQHKLMLEGGWIDQPGVTMFNFYRPPVRVPGNKDNAGPWLDFVKRLYPNDVDEIVGFFAHRTQHPGEKINHALVFTGPPRIGKETLIEPLRHAVGEWNFKEISAEEVVSPHNDFMQSVVLRISETHDRGELDRYKYYEKTKTMFATPPETKRINTKYIPQFYAFNVCGCICTSNHESDGLYLPPDDGRHYVCGTEIVENPETEKLCKAMWAWYYAGGFNDVVAYLAAYDLTGKAAGCVAFDAKATPKKTAAFWRMADAGAAPEDIEFKDYIDKFSKTDPVTGEVTLPPAVTLESLPYELREWVTERTNRRKVPHNMERCGYVPVRNTNANDGHWKLHGRRRAIYALKSLPPAERYEAAKALKVAADAKDAEDAKKAKEAADRAARTGAGGKPKPDAEKVAQDVNDVLEGLAKGFRQH